MTTKVPNYKEKLRAKLNSLDTVMSVFIYLKLVPHVMKLVGRDRDGYLTDIENELLQMGDFKEVKKRILMKVNELIGELSTELDQNTKYQLVLDHIEKKLDIVIHSELKVVFNQLESDRRFAHFYYASTRYKPNISDILAIKDFLREYDKYKKLDRSQKKFVRAPDVYKVLSPSPVSTQLINISMYALLSIHNELGRISSFKNPPIGFLKHIDKLNANYLELEKVSKTRLTKNLHNESGKANSKYRAILYEYLDGKFSLNEYHETIDQKLKIEIAIYQVDYVFIVNRDCHELVLNRIQSKWHKEVCLAKDRGITKNKANEKKDSTDSQKERLDHESQVAVEKAELIPDMPTQELSNQPTPTEAVQTVLEPSPKQIIRVKVIVRKKNNVQSKY
uniref:hypothetical protein n=1 Tax=uncultured Acinetobacter sp. TaxID=165433 RepID=UPI00263058FD|nr:hypothetical protein [uncultured Acinetobacter sp.]